MPVSDRERAFLADVARTGALICMELERLRHGARELNLPLDVPAKLPVLQMISAAAMLKHRDESPPRP